MRTRDFVPEVLHLEEGEMKTLNCPNDGDLHWCAVNDEIPSLNTSLPSINITATKSTCPEVYNTPPYPICDGMLVICINKTSCDMCSYMHLVQRPYLILVKENESEPTCNGRSLANTTSFPTILFLVMGILLHMTLVGT